MDDTAALGSRTLEVPSTPVVYGLAEVPLVEVPPLRWRVVARLSPLAVPVRYDLWLAARMRRALPGYQARLGAWLVGFAGVLALLAVRARVRPGLTLVAIGSICVLGA